MPGHFTTVKTSSHWVIEKQSIPIDLTDRLQKLPDHVQLKASLYF